MTGVRYPAQGRLDFFPPTLVFQAPTDELRDERASPPPSDATVELRRQFIRQHYVQTHGRN